MLYVAGIVLGLAAGFALRGRLRWLAGNVQLRWVWILYVALGGQLFIAFTPSLWLSIDVKFAILLASYGILVTWLAVTAAAHRSWVRWAFVVVAAGSALNLAAIAPNRGIPVSRDALRKAGAPIPAGTANRFAIKHVLAGPDTIFNGLGDVIPVRPLRDVISVGDIIVGLGVAMVVAAGMRLRPEGVPFETAAAGAVAGSSPPEDEAVTPAASATGQAVVVARGAARGGFLDRETTVGDFVARFAGAYSVGKGYGHMSEQPRTPSQTRVVLSQAMSITDANLAGNVHGGVVMKLVDTAAGLAAIKHARGRVVTVSMDEMSFLEPVFLTDVVTLYAQVNDVGRTSMEVGVRVEAENTVTGEKRHVSSAYLVFVALDADGKPRPVPALEPENDEERRRREDAKIRRRHRIARKEALMERRGFSPPPTPPEGASSSPPDAAPQPPSPAPTTAEPSTSLRTLAREPLFTSPPAAPVPHPGDAPGLD